MASTIFKVMEADLFVPSAAVQVIFTLPALIAVTTPFASTAAIFSLLLFQV